MRAARSTWAAITLIATSSTAAEISAMMAAARRERVKFCMVPSSIRLLELDQDRIGEKEDPDHRGEEDGIAQIDDAAHDRVEMGEKAEGRDRAQRGLGRPSLERAQDDGRAADREEEAHGGGHDEGDHLVLGERRERRADRQERAR